MPATLDFDPDEINLIFRRGDDIEFLLRAMNQGRAVLDAVFAKGSTTVTSVTAAFTSDDVGSVFAAEGIPDGTTIDSVTSGTEVELTDPSTERSLGTAATIFTPFPVDFTGHTGLAQIKADADSDTVLAAITVTLDGDIDGANGYMQLAISHEDTENIADTLYWDMQTTDADDKVRTWYTGTVEVSRDISRVVVP